MITPTHNDLAASHWQRFKDDCAEAGQYVRPSPINTKAGEALASKHFGILTVARFELGNVDTIELIDELLTDSVSVGEIGHDGMAAYFEARASLGQMKRVAA